MGGKYKAYPEYKDSGVEWLGDVPAHWVVAMLRRSLLEHKQGYYTTDSYVDDGIKLLRITDLRDYGGIDISSCPKVPCHDTSLVNYELKKGDVVFARTGGAGSFGVVGDLDETIVFASYLIRFRFCENSFLNGYLKYLLLADSFQKAVKQNVHGGVNQNIHAEDIKNAYLARPTLEEQEALTNFLDRETAKIDTLIEEQQSLIRLLKEKRQAVISHAVTKGLPSITGADAPMKDSGVEWLGEVPEHWEVKRIKHFGRVVGGFAFKSGDFSDSGYPVVKISNVGHFKFEWGDSSFLPDSFSETQDEYKAPKNALIFAMTRPVIAGGIKVVKIDDDSRPLINQRVGFLSIKDDLIAEYILQSTQSSSFLAQFINNMTVTNQPNISSEGIEAIYFPVPPRDELESTLNTLKKIEVTYTKLLSESQDQIEFLKERRTALISAAVTGKIDVRDWQPAAEQQEHPAEATA